MSARRTPVAGQPLSQWRKPVLVRASPSKNSAAMSDYVHRRVLRPLRVGSTMSARQDFLRDWHRWTAAERVSAALLGTIAALSLPAAILLNLHMG
jgi:hypothetical protein